MAGHSQFKNIMYRKGAQDAKRAKIFAKLAREITVAAKQGVADPDMNPRLRTAIAAARSANMPKDNIERAVKKGAAGDDDTVYGEMRYEGFGPGGVAVIVEALTDNRNRTAAEVRASFTRHAGNLGESGSVNFMFNHVGVVRYAADVADVDDMFETAVEAGAENVNSNDNGHQITCEVGALYDVRDALAVEFGEPNGVALEWLPVSTVSIDENQAETLFKLIDALEDNDDVQSVAANFDISDDIMQWVSARG